jgi:hypothetical protein
VDSVKLRADKAMARTKAEAEQILALEAQVKNIPSGT